MSPLRRTPLKRAPLQRPPPGSTAARTFTCEVCGETFERYASQVRHRGAGRWCSQKCRDAGERRRPIQCQGCSESFVPPVGPGRKDKRGKFCSRECWTAWLAAQPKRIRSFTCKVCGVTFTRPEAWGKAVTCSLECKAKRQRRAGATHYRGKGWRKIAATIRERDGRCVRCGGADAGRVLSVDHVIPWVMCSTEQGANDPANLACLCLRCHGEKTTLVEPRLLRGDFLGLFDFYGRELAGAAMAAAL